MQSHTLHYEVVIGGARTVHSRPVEMTVGNMGQRTAFVLSPDARDLSIYFSNLRQQNAIDCGRKPAYGADPEYKAPPIDVAAEVALAILTGGVWFAYTDGKLDRHKADVYPNYQSRSTGTGCLLTHPDDSEDHTFVAFSGSLLAIYAEGWLPGREAKVNWGDHFGQNRPCFLKRFSDLRSMSEFDGG